MLLFHILSNIKETMLPISSNTSLNTTENLNCDSGVSDSTRVTNTIFQCLNSNLSKREVRELKGRVVHGNVGFQLKGTRVLNSGISNLPNGKELEKHIAKDMSHVTNYMHHVSTSTLKHPIITFYQDWCLSNPEFSTIHQQARTRKLVVSNQLKDFLGKIPFLQELNEKCVPHIETVFKEYKDANSDQRPFQPQSSEIEPIIRLANGRALTFKGEEEQQPQQEELANYMKETFPISQGFLIFKSGEG